MGNAKKIVDRVWELMESGQHERFAEVVSPDSRTVMSDGTVIRGPHELAELQKMWWSAFPDLRHEIQDYVELGDSIAVELTATGTHTGPLMTPNGAIPATGKKVTIRSVDMIKVKDGKVISWHVYFDQLSFMTQLGVGPGSTAQGEVGEALVRRFGEEIISKGRLELVPEVFASSCVYHFPGMPPLDTAAHNQLISAFRESFPDSKLVIDEILTSGDRVVTRYSYSATHTGAPFKGLPPSKKRFEIAGINIDRVSGGRIVEHWGSADFLGMMEQIGALAR
jgi:predicted ester cyclase